MAQSSRSMFNLDDVVPLQAVLDLVEFRNQLDHLCRSQWRWGGLEEARVQILRWHRRKRCTFSVALMTETGLHDLIGKVYVTDRPDVYELMTRAWQAGFDANAEFSVPQALAHLPALRLRFEEYVQGRSAKDIFLEGAPAEQFAAAERCGDWLARFHTSAPRLGKVAETSEVLPHLRWWRDFLASFGEPLAGKSELLLEKLEAAASALGPIEFCTGHGSYLPEHVFPTPDRTVTIDLDDYDLGDPARDVAWFVVGLERRALKNLGSHHALDSAVEAFCETYASSGPREVMARLPFWKAVQYLRGARNDAKSKPPQWREMAEAMLDEALGSLNLSVVGQG